MRNLFVYHPGSGTLISLSDPVYLVDASIADEDAIDRLDAEQRREAMRRIDNYNMTHLFFGGK